MIMLLFFFFSSRRRHTRYWRDWSSDVCSSDLGNIAGNGRIKGVAPDIGFKSYRVFDSKGDTNASIMSSAIIKAADDGVNVINLSMSGYDLKGKCYWTDSETGIKHDLGDDMAEYELYKRAIQYALSHNVVV